MELLRNDKIIAYRESEHKGRASSADDCLDGSVSYPFTRSSPQGEEDTLAVCIRLVTVLNLACASWSEPQNGSDGVDCLCLDLAAGSMRLAIQVVRANVDSAWWRKIDETGSGATTGESAADCAHILKRAIDKKVSRIPRAHRAELLLALDATRLAGLALPVVVDEFRRRYAAWLSNQGFAAVWIVGPTESLVRQLDSMSNHG